ncbi:hypothetical protein [Bacterioplanes sanyensis]|uniref:hypothetical protein n=1 Tax=Bacterioplanes sanyensis TaxID=1249553 RepID=UPI0016766AEB|nr:hypothetical protein [Bacterioplanes sanyensis]
MKMMMFSICLAFPINALSIELKDGLGPGDVLWGKLTAADFEAGYSPTFAVDAGDGVVYTYDSTIGKANYEKGVLLYAWPIHPWPGHLFFAGEYAAAAEAASIARGGDFELPENPTEIVSRVASYLSLDSTMPAGCLKSIPLRYGDFDSDGTSEVVLFAGASIVFFSPLNEEVIFSYHYELNDELIEDTEKEIFPPPYSDSDPQYFSDSGADVLVMQKLQAQKSYSKIFVSSFDGDDALDIILWRKMYRSNLRSEAVPGFHMIGEAAMHYELVEGGYALQETSTIDALTWLEDKKLTWQQGFPSRSECPGEEDKLIPEMHDPLLNDPDVLR